MSSSFRSPAAVAGSDFLLSAPPDRPGPRVAPSEAELLIDPHFYSFLSGVAIVLVLLSFSFCFAYMLLSAIRRRQYRKYRQRRRLEDERDRIVYSTAPLPTATRQVARTPAPPAPPPVFVPRLQPLSSAPLSSSYALQARRGSLPAFLAPFSAVLSRDGSLPAVATGAVAGLPRPHLSFASPSSFASSVSRHSRALWSMLTPRRRRPAAADFTPHSLSSASPSPYPLRQSPNMRSPLPSSVSSPADATRSIAFGNGTLHNEARLLRDSMKPQPFSRQPRSDPPSARPSISAAPLTSRLLSLSHQEELDAQQYEHNRGFLSFSLSTFLLTIALLWLSLIPLTLALHSSLTDYYLLSWLTPHLVSSLWTLVTFLSTLSLFVVSPFAYLYYEAEGLFFLPLPTFLPSLSGTRSHDDDDDAYTFLPRFMETALILFCFSVMLYGSFHLVHCLLYGLPIISFNWSNLLSLSFMQLLTPSALFSNVLHFLPGLFICLSQSHAGFSTLLSSAFSLRVPFFHQHYLRQQLDLIGIKLNHTRLLLPATTSLSRRLVLANRIQSLEQHSTDINKKLYPPLLSLSYFPVLRNAVWFVTTLVCLLLIWHVVVRVMQREARLMVGSLEAMMGDSEGEQRGVVMTAVGLLLAALKWLLRIMKNGINTLLSMLGMIRRADAHKSTAVGDVDGDSAPAFLSVGFLLQLWSDSLRLLSSFLLGHNGFKHPITHLLFDLTMVNFFCWSCAIGLYRMPWMAQYYSPFSSFAAKASAAFEFNDGTTEAVLGGAEQSGEGSRAVQQVPPASLQSATASSSAASVPSGAAARLSSSVPQSVLSSPSALYSAQFFVVNTTVVLLLVSSFPFAVWLLGLSSFPLPDFYPAASELTAGWFVHCYNLAFIALSAGQGFSLWSRLLWYLVNTFYHSSYALLTWILPSLRARLPTPQAVAALPVTVRAHPYAVRLSFLCSAAGLRWAAKAIVLPMLYLLWLLLLYLLRGLAVGLKLCARGLYVKAVKFLNEEMNDPELPSLGRQRLRQQSQQTIEETADLQLSSPREMSRMRTIEERTLTHTAAASAVKEHELSNGLHEPLAEEGKEEAKPHPPHHSPHHFAVRSSSAGRSPKQPTRLLAPRPLSLAPSVSLDALNSLNPALTPPSHYSGSPSWTDNTASQPPRAVRRSDSAEAQRVSLHSTTSTRASHRGLSEGAQHDTVERSERFDNRRQAHSSGDAEWKGQQVEMLSVDR